MKGKQICFAPIRCIEILSLGIGLLLGATAAVRGQGRIDGRAEPVYPENPYYNFNRAPGNYAPYRFNWGTGRWDYFPFPGEQPPTGAAPYQFNPYTGVWNYAPWPAPSAASAPPTPSTVVVPLPRPGVRQNNDSRLWIAPTTQPEQTPPSPIADFTGKLAAVQAIDLAGEPSAHLILRLRSDAGTNMSVDVGSRVDLSDLTPNVPIHARGYMGSIDGTPVMFANQLDIGGHAVNLERPTSAPSGK